VRRSARTSAISTYVRASVRIAAPDLLAAGHIAHLSEATGRIPGISGAPAMDDPAAPQTGGLFDGLFVCG
jgi:hypothetical protein